MSRRDDGRLADFITSAEAMKSHLSRGGLDDGLVFDAVRVRLIEIGEAVKDIDPDLLAGESHIPWGDVAGMRDHLAHRYFDTAHSVVQATVDHDLPPLLAAARRSSPQLADCWRRGRQPPIQTTAPPAKRTDHHDDLVDLISLLSNPALGART